MVNPELQFSSFLFDGKSAKKTRSYRINAVSYHSYIFQPFCGELALFRHLMGYTSPFNIEHQLNILEGERLETLVVENPDFYENCQIIASNDFSRTTINNTFN
jgi:hypothetical protein